MPLAQSDNLAKLDVTVLWKDLKLSPYHLTQSVFLHHIFLIQLHYIIVRIIIEPLPIIDMCQAFLGERFSLP